MTIGNVETGITEGAVSRLNNDFHATVSHRCRGCWALRLCGVCFAAQAENYDPETGVLSVPEALCRQVRVQKEETMKMMVRILAMPQELRTWLDEVKIL